MAPIDAANSRGLTVAIVGAECSGKTTLAEALARRFDAPWVPEYSRSYLANRTSYEADDVLAIAQGQYRAEAALTADESLLFADTDLVVIKIWWDVRFGGTIAWIDSALEAALSNARQRRYLVPTPDIPWIADPLRENPSDRPALHARYIQLLDVLGAQYAEISGSPQQRLDLASRVVENWMAQDESSGLYQPNR